MASETYHTYRSSSGGRTPPASYIDDEQDRMKQRMKEFEERCRKWREEFFSKDSTLNSVPLATDFEVPSSFGNQDSYFARPIVSGGASTLHKGFVEDGRDGKKVYKVELEIGDFHSNELDISTRGKMLIVKGDREIRAGSTTETKTFSREITLPDYVDATNLNAYLIDNNLTGGSTMKSVSSLTAAFNSKLIVEAPIVNDIYYSRRSGINSAVSRGPSPAFNSSTYRAFSPKFGASEQLNTTKTSSHYSSTKNLTRLSNQDLTSTPKQTIYVASPVHTTYDTSKSYSSSANDELVPGYPLYSKEDGYMIYKFNLNGFDQSEIHLSITEYRTLEIKACKEIADSLGKTYREFKREIQLDANMDVNRIKNVLSHDGILTLKLPVLSSSSSQSMSPKFIVNGSLKNATTVDANNNSSANGFREFYSNTGKLVKLTCDLNGYDPENLKILLSAQNELKIVAQRFDKTGSSSRLQKQCTKQYCLPSYIQPESMKAVMSRDGTLTVDFNNN
jgi:HSP20 family molecular chaperone IbpA